jgi:putative toxin-antitoxin system antitoxin component (TIGR02293 family)
MSEKPLAEAYEKLKELRRSGAFESEKETTVVDRLDALYREVVAAKAPDRLADLIRRLGAGGSHASTNLVRLLDIRILADRVFGDEEKAETWLNRPSAALSGQKPIDLLKDELGAAVVREMLERIDHGIFA